METKHTPGPWEANFSFPGQDGIGDVWQIDAFCHAVCTTQFCYAPNTEANARLLAAAPELLEALILVLPLAKGYRPEGQTAAARRTCNSWIDAAEAAIAKATGGDDGSC